jgi:hypothetical protein
MPRMNENERVRTSRSSSDRYERSDRRRRPKRPTGRDFGANRLSPTATARRYIARLIRFGTRAGELESGTRIDPPAFGRSPHAKDRQQRDESANRTGIAAED